MNQPSFIRSLEDSKNFLKKWGFLKMQGVKNIWKDGISDSFKKSCIKDDYAQIYRVAIRNFDYDFLLNDQSILQFSFSENGDVPNLRFAFYQNPQDFVSYLDFLKMLQDRSLIDDEENLMELGDIFIEEYEQFLTEQKLSLNSMTVRFDVSRDGRHELSHSIAHMHFGHGNDMRVPCDKILTPLKFTLFIIKHFYYYAWRSNLNKDGFVELVRREKTNCVKLQRNLWTEKEQTELFLT